MNYSDPPGGKLGERAPRILADPQFALAQDLENLRYILEGRTTPEEVQAQPSAANVQGAMLAFLTSGAGVTLLGGLLVALVLPRLLGRRKASGPRSSAGRDEPRRTHVADDRKFRFTVEF